MFLFTSRPMAPKTPLLKRKYLLRKHRKMSGTPALPSSHVYKGMRGSGAGVGGWWIFTPQGEESPGSLLGWGRGVLLFAQPQVPAWGKAGPGAEETGQQSLSGGEGSALKPTKLKEGLSGPVSFPQPVGKVGMER